MLRTEAKEEDLDSILFIDANRDAYIKPSLLITDEVANPYNVAYPLAIKEQPIRK